LRNRVTIFIALAVLYLILLPVYLYSSGNSSGTKTGSGTLGEGLFWLFVFYATGVRFYMARLPEIARNYLITGCSLCAVRPLSAHKVLVIAGKYLIKLSRLISAFLVEEWMDSVSAQKRSWVMSQVKSGDNKSTEKALIAVLREFKLSGWRRHYPIFGKPDFVFPREKVAVFVDGCFWHGHPEKCRVPQANREYWLKKIDRNVARDRLVTRTLKDKGWKVIRIWENMVSKHSTVSRLRRALAQHE